MKLGTKVTILSPLGIRDRRGKMRYAAKQGTYIGLRNGMRTVLHHGGGWSQLEPHGTSRLTTKYVDISPCGLLE